MGSGGRHGLAWRVEGEGLRDPRAGAALWTGTENNFRLESLGWAPGDLRLERPVRKPWAVSKKLRFLSCSVRMHRARRRRTCVCEQEGCAGRMGATGREAEELQWQLVLMVGRDFVRRKSPGSLSRSGPGLGPMASAQQRRPAATAAGEDPARLRVGRSLWLDLLACQPGRAGLWWVSSRPHLEVPTPLEDRRLPSRS